MTLLQRDRAWQIHPYPCIGQFRFLDLSISLHPSYALVLNRLTSKNQPQTLLDLGCCFGQDIRKLVADGAPSSSLYGCDLRPDFFELGYDLFLDRETLQSKFLAGDVFAAAEEDGGKELAKLDGRLDVVHAASFLHLFSWEEQVRACARIVRLLKPVEGSMLLGRQVGSGVPGETQDRVRPSLSRYRHDEESFKKMWKEVGEKTRTRWRVEVESLMVKGGSFASPLHDENTRRIVFAVYRE